MHRRPRATGLSLLLVAMALAVDAGAQAFDHVKLPDGPRFTVAAAQDVMRRGHPLVAATRADAQAAAADALAAGLWTNPTVDAGYQRGATHDSGDVVGASSLGVTQFLETAGAPRARERSARRTEQAVVAQGKGTVQTLAFDVETACVAMVAAATRVAVLQASLEDLSRADRIVQNRVKEGAAPKYDATRMSVAFSQARSALVEAEAGVITARGDLEAAVGPQAAQLQGLPDLDLFAPPTLPALAPLLDGLPRTRPDVVAAQQRALAAEDLVQVARRAVLPGFGLRLGGAYGASPGEFDVVLGVTVALPVVDRGQGTIAASLARAESAQMGAEAVRVQASQRVASAWTLAQRRREALQQFTQTGTTDVRGMQTEAEAGYRAGRLSVFELVDAITSARDARLRWVDLAEAARQAEVTTRRLIEAGP